MNTDDDKLERQIALVKKFYPDRDSLWAFFDTFGIYDFVLSRMKDNHIDNKVNKYYGKRNVGFTDWLYMWEVFIMIEYVSTYNKVQKSESEKEKFNEFEEQFKNL